MSELFSGTREVGYYGKSRSFPIGTQTNNLSLGITLIQVAGTGTVYYGDTEQRTYNVTNSAGNLWTVFTIDGSSKVITAVNSMSAVAGTSVGSASIE